MCFQSSQQNIFFCGLNIVCVQTHKQMLYLVGCSLSIYTYLMMCEAGSEFRPANRTLRRGVTLLMKSSRMLAGIVSLFFSRNPLALYCT